LRRLAAQGHDYEQEQQAFIGELRSRRWSSDRWYSLGLWLNIAYDGGLALLLHVGSPQSKEGDDRMEAKIDAILAAVDPKSADKIIDEIDREYAGRHTDPRWKKLAKPDGGKA
jgi:hypothetical protein